MILLEICFEAVVDVVDDAVDLTVGIRESFSLVGDFESLLEVVFLHSFLLSGSVSSVAGTYKSKNSGGSTVSSGWL